MSCGTNSARRCRITYQAFDLLWLDGEDLWPLPSSNRKARLAKLIGKGCKRLFGVELFETTGSRMWTSTCKPLVEASHPSGSLANPDGRTCG